MKKHIILLVLSLVFMSNSVFADPSQFSALLTNSTDYSGTWNTPTRPAYGGTHTDSTWGTTTRRLNAMTDCLIDGSHPTACDTRNFYPDYNKQQPWNADGSKILVLDSNGWYHLYDAETLADIRRITDATGLSNDNDIRWSHTDPDVIYYRNGLTLSSYNIDTHVVTVEHTFSCTDGTNTGVKVSNGDEGNSDISDRYWAFRCQYNPADYTTIDVIVYDRQEDTVIAQEDVATICGGSCSKEINWVGISPLGTGVLIGWSGGSNDDSAYVRGTGTELFSLGLEYQGKLSSTASHGDVGFDTDGNEVYVSDWNLNYDAKTIKWRRLDNLSLEGRITLPSSWTNDSTKHISMRSHEEPGWALVSTYKVTNTQGTGWGASELVAVKIDSSISNNNEWYRIGRTFSIRDNHYYAEPHAVTNSDFTKIMWGSNWIDTAGIINPYVLYLNKGRKYRARLAP